MQLSPGIPMVRYFRCDKRMENAEAALTAQRSSSRAAGVQNTFKGIFWIINFFGYFRYLLIENSGILVFWYFSCNFICWCVWYYWQNSYISATLCTKNDGSKGE